MLERLLVSGSCHQVRVRCTSRDDGDFHVDGPGVELAQRRRLVAPGEWTWLHQIHGAAVVEVDHPGAGAGSSGDASVTSVPGAVLAVQSADCAPVVMTGGGVVGVAHAGWRGLVAGVIPATVAALRRRTSAPISALLGPVIRPANYELGEIDLEAVVAVAGPAATGRTAEGRPALDMGAAVAGILAAEGVTDFEDLKIDTADVTWFSHRVRADAERQVTVAWLEELV